MNHEPSRPKVVLVTGGCGFIGSNFVNHIAKEWPTSVILNLDKMCVGSNPMNIDQEVRGLDRYHGIVGDIGDRKLVHELMAKYQVDTVINFAANSHVDASYEDPVETSENNVLGMVRLLEAARGYGGLSLFVQISSDEVYGDSGLGPEEVPKKEDAPLLPTNPYAAGKAGCEALLRAYGASYRIPFRILRLNNVFGPRQWADKVVPRFIARASRGTGYPLMGDGGQLRSWLFVEDACKGIRRVVEEGKEGEVYNIGSQTEFSIHELATKIHHEVGKQLSGGVGVFKTLSIPDRPYNDRRYLISSEKAKKEVGWESEWSFQEGLEKTVAWYLDSETRPGMGVHFLIFGSQGWIGSQFCDLLKDRQISFTRARSRIGQISDIEVEKEIKHSGASHVVCVLGRTQGPGSPSIDFLEGGPEKLDLNIRDNLFAPWLLASITAKLELHMTYVGTGCIFQYDQDHPIGGEEYREEEEPTFKGNSYSAVKGYADKIIQTFPHVLNARIRIPVNFQDSSRNLLTKIHGFNCLTNIPQSITVLPDVLPLLLDMAMESKVGTFNATNPGPISFAEIMSLWNEGEKDKTEVRVLKDDAEEVTALQKKRAHCALSTDKISAFRPLRPAKDAISEAIANIKKSRTKT